MILSSHENLSTMFYDTMKMNIYSRVKTGNQFIDAIVTTLFFTCIGCAFNFVSQKNFANITFNVVSLYDWVVSCFYKKLQVELEGKRSFITTVYSSHNNVSTSYSNRFKAFWIYIIKNIDNNKSIYKIKENVSNIQTFSKYEDINKMVDLFVVSQKEKFVLEPHIYAVCNFYEDNTNNGKMTTKTENITITIYSYKYSISYLKNYIDKITFDYLDEIKTNRYNKKFIYTLEKTSCVEDETKYSCWSESKFVSCRNFSNMFFEGKNDLINQINFFLNNKEWYESKGIPWTCGIGLYGPPGTGKTSFIKALANYTGHHLVFISLKLIKTKQQLMNFFFEDTYNNNNEPNSITFDKKITIFEDIDCIGDIVLKRTEKFNARNKNKNTINYLNEKDSNDVVKLGDIAKLIELNNSEGQKQHVIGPAYAEEPITLDDLLNLWDGVRETPGRILIITSNHYDELDPALIRPGRIDITHEFKNANRETIAKIYKHLFQTDICQDKLQEIQEYLYSPAEIINMFLSNKTEERFLERLAKNEKP